MATFIMLPDGVTGMNNWQNYGGATADHTMVDDDTFVTSYIYETRVNGEVTFTMADPSVVEGDIDTINHVTVKLKAHYTEVGAVPPAQITALLVLSSFEYALQASAWTVLSPVPSCSKNSKKLPDTVGKIICNS